MADAPTSPAEDPVLAAIRTRLGYALRIVLATPRHTMHVIVWLSCAFELCNIEGHNFDWFLKFVANIPYVFAREILTPLSNIVLGTLF